MTTFSFVEVDDKGNPLAPPRLLTVKGDMAYVEYRVVKVQRRERRGRGATRCGGPRFRPVPPHLRRASESGRRLTVLDAVGSRPAGYHDGHEMSAFEEGNLGPIFWDFLGRAIRPRPRKRGSAPPTARPPTRSSSRASAYKALLRASGGLSFQTDELSQAAERPGVVNGGSVG